MAPASFFVERDSLEYKQFQTLLGQNSPTCEVVLACDPDQAALLAARCRGKARFLVIQGGLADGRAAALLRMLEKSATAPAFEFVAYSDRRHSRGALEEPDLDSLGARLKPALTGGWILVRFLEPHAAKKPTS